MKKLSIKEWGDKIRSVTIRFTFPVFFIIGLSILFFIQINQKNADISEHLWAFFGLAIPLSVAVTLFSEEFKNRLLRAGINLLAIVLLVLYTFTLPDKLFDYHYYQIFTLGLVFILCSFVVSFFRRETDISFWEFSKTSILQLIITIIFSQVLMMGLSLAILSLDKLFSINVSEKVYGNLAVICYALFAPVYFLANVPDEMEKRLQEFKFDKFLKILGLYILLPILALYTIILYVYAIQIVAKWELPNGWVTWLVSVLALGGFLCMMIVYPLRLQGNKIALFVSRFFPVILFPLLILMTVGIFRRFDDYGLTINRAYVFLLNFWLYGICIYLFISQSKHLKWIVISFSIIAFLSSVGPWSVYNVTKNKMMNEIKLFLTSNHFLKNGKIIDKAELAKLETDPKQEEIIASKIDYIVSNYGINTFQPLFPDSIKGENSAAVLELLAIDVKTDLRSGKNYFSVNSAETEHSHNISDFNYFLNLSMKSGSKILFQDSNYRIEYVNYQINVFKSNSNTPVETIPIKEKLKYFANSESETKFKSEDLTVSGENYQLIINSLNGNTFSKNDSISINQFEANLFLK